MKNCLFFCVVLLSPSSRAEWVEINISIGEWKKRAAQIETVLDCTILRIENKGSKRIIQMLAVSSEYKIPDKLLWEEGYLSNEDGVCVIGQGMLSQISFNLNRTPHVLAAGETGSGKSVILRCCLWIRLSRACGLKRC